MSPPGNDCEFYGEHKMIDNRLDQLEAREDKQDEAIEAVRAAGAGIREELAGLRGEVRGALAASKLGGSIVGALVSLGGAGGVALLVYLLNRHP